MLGCWNDGIKDLELNLHVHDCPHLSTYQDTQAEQMMLDTMDVDGGHLGTGAHQSCKLSCSTTSSHTGFGRDIAANAVMPFHAPRTTRMRIVGNCAGTRSANNASTSTRRGSGFASAAASAWTPQSTIVGVASRSIPHFQAATIGTEKDR